MHGRQARTRRRRESGACRAPGQAPGQGSGGKRFRWKRVKPRTVPDASASGAVGRRSAPEDRAGKRPRFGYSEAKQRPAGRETMSIPFPKPDEGVIARRDEIIAGLARLVAPEALIVSDDERRAFETDALTAYRKMPLAVVLPSTTEEVSEVLKFCREQGVKVVPRGAGTSLCGGAIAQEDAIILGVSKMNRVLEMDFANRAARVQTGITNLAISQAVSPDGFFYAPDPSSQLACTIAGNIAMNSGGAHCLRYGVTTNNLLGVKIVLLDGTVVEIGGKHLDSP